MKKTVYLILALLLMSANACSNKKAGEETAKANPLAEKWISAMRDGLPPELCKDSMYFRQCFQVNQEECLSQAKSSFDKCLPSLKNDILKNFGAKGNDHLSADGAEWGAKIGECSGIDYEKSLIAKRINSNKCNDPKNWLGN